MRSHALSLSVAGLCGALTAQSHDLQIIYINSPGHPTNVVPGTGLPFNLGGGANSAFNRPWVSANGLHWAMTVAIESPSLTNDEAVLLDGSLVFREGAPVPWPTTPNPSEVLGQHFFTEIGIDNSGTILLDHATGIPGNQTAATNDYVVRYNMPAATWTVLAHETELVSPTLLGLVGDGSPVPTATWDDNLDSSRLTNTGFELWRADGIDGLSTGTANDAVVLLGGGAFLQKGVSVPVGQAGGASESWEVFDNGDVYISPDGSTWMVQGDLTGATTGDDVVVLNGVVLMQEGVAFPPFASPIDQNGVAKPWIDRGGNWYVRGDNVDQNDWVVRNYAVVAYSDGTDPIATGLNEHWDDSITSACFFGFDGNSLGHYLIAGVTDNPDVSRNAVFVVNDGQGNSYVAVREGDPIDLNGNGLFDDDRFLASFGDDDMQLLDDDSILFLATVRDGTGTSIEHGFFRLVPRSGSCTFVNGSGTNPVAMTCVTQPIIGTNFVVDVSFGPNTIATAPYLSFASIVPTPIPPYAIGELLIDPVAYPFPASFPVYAGYLGLKVYMQGLRLENNFDVVLTNGQNVVFGY